MAARASSLPSRVQKSNSGDDVGNRILRGLDPATCKDLVAKMVPVQLRLRDVLHDAGVKISQCYFISSGLISVVSIQPDGRAIEAGLIGNEGFIGLPVIVGYTTSPTRMVVQAEGAAYRCSVATLRELMRGCPELEVRLQRYVQQLAMQTTQFAVCNRLHDIEERLARWILMYHDRLFNDRLPLTHEFLSQMLGTRRASVTEAAAVLRKAGLISYRRGMLTILDRRGLESAACDCYAVVHAQLIEWEAQIAR